MTDEDKINPLFLQLVISLQSAAMYQMGKPVSPISGEVERDLNQAKISIDLLTMLQEKTAGNLKDEEKQILDSAVYNLQMNYIEELELERSNKAGDKNDDKPKSEADPATTENESNETFDNE